MRASSCTRVRLALLVFVCTATAAHAQNTGDGSTVKAGPANDQQPADPAQPPAEPSQPPPQPPAAPAPPDATGAGGPGGSLPVYGNAAGSSKVFNPDIAVIGNFLGALGKNDVDPPPVLSMHESELSLQAVVDPYARADFFIAFSEEGAELEEGFVTFPTLPGGLLMKVGKIKAAFGRINQQHSHLLPWTDRPIVMTNLLGGEEGLTDSGISVAGLIPNPWIYLEAVGQVFRGETADGAVFQTHQRSDVSVTGHLRGYRDITESTNLDLGVSYARGHNGSGVVDDVDEGRFTTDLIGLDATLRWRPLRRSIYRSFIARAEAMWSRREQPDGRQDASGFFVSGDYQFARRWFAGVRLDSSERAADAAARDVGQSALVTFWPSEFSQIRAQYRRIDYAEGDVANELLFQFQFSIGAHGAHPF